MTWTQLNILKIEPWIMEKKPKFRIKHAPKGFVFYGLGAKPMNFGPGVYLLRLFKDLWVESIIRIS